MKELNEGIKRIENNCCPLCGTPMKNGYDETLGAISIYIWEPQCECYGKNIRISKG